MFRKSCSTFSIRTCSNSLNLSASFSIRWFHRIGKRSSLHLLWEVASSARLFRRLNNASSGCPRFNLGRLPNQNKGFRHLGSAIVGEDEIFFAPSKKCRVVGPCRTLGGKLAGDHARDRFRGSAPMVYRSYADPSCDWLS